MGFSRRFSMAGSLLATVLSAGASAMSRGPAIGDDSGPPIALTHGGYHNRAHSWDGSGPKQRHKAQRGLQPRRSKAQRRARAA